MHDAAKLVHETASMTWQPEADGIERIDLAREVGGFDVAMFRLPAGRSLPPAAGDLGREVLVCAGNWQLGGATLHQHGYARIPPGSGAVERADTDTTLLVRTGAFAADDSGLLRVDSREQSWLQGQGNLRVQPLHSMGDGGTALVHWPAGERFQPHRHWGGEEIFVLSGTFEDEHGRYPTGTWLLSPHLSSHHPFVSEETIIFVKTGHLPQVPPEGQP